PPRSAATQPRDGGKRSHGPFNPSFRGRQNLFMSAWPLKGDRSREPSLVAAGTTTFASGSTPWAAWTSPGPQATSGSGASMAQKCGVVAVRGSAFVGRREELAQFAGCLDAAADGQGGLVLLT